MDTRTQLKLSPIALALLAAAALAAVGCSSTSSPVGTGTNPAVQTAPAFVVGTDAPSASVTSFAVQLNNVCAVSTDATTGLSSCTSLISGTPTVDFARFNGLQTLLDLNDVPVGTYTGIQITLGPATIGYLNTVAGSAPTIATEAATYPNSAATYTYTTSFTNPLVVSTTAPVGLRMDFDLRKSIVVDVNGNITGAVTPTFNIDTVQTSDPGAYIDCFDAAVVSAPAAGAQSFTIQGPHGRQFTVNVNGQTEWDNNESIADLTSSSIVRISGTLDRADSTFDANEVAILSQDGFYADGTVTNVDPSTGPATSFDLYVRGILPTTTGLTLGQIATVDLTGNEKFYIYWAHNPLTEFLFNSSTLLPGQHIAVGGPATGAANPDAVTVKRISLHHWGFNGTVVPGSENSGNGTFQMQITGFAGLLVPQTVTVYTSQVTDFRDGLTGFSGLTDGEKVRVVGLLIKDPLTGNTVLLSRYVDELD